MKSILTIQETLRQDFIENNRISRKLFDKCFYKTLRAKNISDSHHWSEHIPTYLKALKETQKVFENVLAEELCNREVLCDCCPCTEYGSVKVNTSPYDLCEGCRCSQALENYLDEVDDETWKDFVRGLST